VPVKVNPLILNFEQYTSELYDSHTGGFPPEEQVHYHPLNRKVNAFHGRSRKLFVRESKFRLPAIILLPGSGLENSISYAGSWPPTELKVPP